MTKSASERIDDLLAIHPKGFDLSLGRIERLLESLGRPQDRLPPVIHVAGTNGKGSTIAFMRAMLEAAGESVHVHTSPHLVSWHERYRIGKKGGGALVSDAALADAVDRVASANAGRPTTVFEILTAVTFLLFSEHHADVVLLEVGLGGRFDATNVIDAPKLSVITPVSLDHESYLGDRMEVIAAEKAGIIKKGVPVVIGEQEDGARAVIEEVALRLRAPAFIFGQDYAAHEEGGRMVYQDEDGLLDLPLPRLPGQHQIDNAATAIAVLRRGGFDLRDGAVEAGLKNVIWPGRLQRLDRGKLADAVSNGSEIWIDGGHNPGAGTAISSFICGLEDRVQRPLVLICGMLTTKDPAGFFAHFRGMTSQVYTVPILSSDAGFPAGDLAEFARQCGLEADAAGLISEAIGKAVNRYPDGPAPRLLICGSLYLVGDVLAENGTPPT